MTTTIRMNMGATKKAITAYAQDWSREAREYGSGRAATAYINVSVTLHRNPGVSPQERADVRSELAAILKGLDRHGRRDARRQARFLAEQR